MSDFEARFGGIARLYGRDGSARLRAAHVAVIGVGGVGSWAAEALARSGVGRITMVDADEVCVSNVNRQLPALDGAVGQPKVVALAGRLALINPEIRVEARQEFFTGESADSILGEGIDYVCDAIDSLAHKAALVAECRRRGIAIIVSGSAGGRVDGTAARITDLAQASHDPLLQKLRKKLRGEHGFPTDPKARFGVPCVYSMELARRPGGCEAGEESLRMDCNSGYGSATFVTGAFGFAAAGWIVSALAEGRVG